MSFKCDERRDISSHMHFMGALHSIYARVAAFVFPSPASGVMMCVCVLN